MGEGLVAVGLTLEGYAKLLCPVDTGRLRISITFDVRDNTVYIGTNVEYAA
jgi:phage gpG-like protein